MNKHPACHTKQGKASTGLLERDGYVLLFVVVGGLILAIGAMVISARSFNSLMRSSKQSEGDQAIEIAETGASILLNKLNNNFPYLLTKNCQVENNALSQQFEEPICTGWQDFEFGELGGPASACPGRSTEPADIMEQLSASVSNEKGQYRLRNYEFLGDQIQGGTAIIQVQGQRIKHRGGSPIISASAIVEQEVTITPKYCGLPPFDKSSGSSSGFGLLAGNISLNSSSIIDQVPGTTPSQANVNCNNCSHQPSPDKTIPWKGVQSGDSKIDGDRSSNPEPKPGDFPAPQWEWGKTRWDLIVNWQTINIGHNTHPNHCYTEDISPPITHCRMGNITISGGNVNINPGEGEIRFYLQGQMVSINTNNFLNSSGTFGQVAFFSQEGGPWGCTPQSFNLSGSDKFGPVFLQMPCTDMPLSGNVDIIGAAIVKSWRAAGNSDLIVPPDAAQIINDQYNISLGKNIGREFAALGTNRWTLIQMERSTNE